MALAPDHAFVDQLLTHSCDGTGFDAQHGGNVPGLERALSEFRHSAKVFLLKRGQTIKANAEEVGIQMGYNPRRCSMNIGAPDWALWCKIPNMEAPFLNEIGIALRYAQDFIDRVVFKINPFVFGGMNKGGAGGQRVKLAYFRIVK